MQQYTYLYKNICYNPIGSVPIVRISRLIATFVKVNICLYQKHSMWQCVAIEQLERVSYLWKLSILFISLWTKWTVPIHRCAEGLISSLSVLQIDLCLVGASSLRQNMKFAHRSHLLQDTFQELRDEFKSTIEDQMQIKAFAQTQTLIYSSVVINIDFSTDQTAGHVSRNTTSLERYKSWHSHDGYI